MCFRGSKLTVQLLITSEMGRATRWVRKIFGSKKDSTIVAATSDRREKKRWSFKSPMDSSEPAQASADWLRSFYAESEKEQNKQAIAVAAATAAAADAAIAAAQAAVAVVRLTRHGRRTMFGHFHEWMAAVKIQRMFRGYLAKKALRALKALVKLQALVRGYLVRKQTAATFHSMLALIKAQKTIRAQKCRALLSSERRYHQDEIPRASLEASSLRCRKQLPASLDNSNSASHGSPMVRPKSRWSRRYSYFAIENSDEISPNSTSSPLPDIGRISIPDYRLSFDKCRHSSTEQSTPRRLALSTPTKSVFSNNSINSPNYMNNTKCFEAKKVRSQSTPKQRPEIMGSSKRLPLSELVIEQSRASLSGVRMRKVEELSFKRREEDDGRQDRSLELSSDAERDFYLQSKW